MDTCCADHLKADMTHAPVPDWDENGDCSICEVCGLAVTALGERHGHYDPADCD